MPPNTNNKDGGNSGRAASVTASRCAAARAGHSPVFRSLAVMAAAITVLLLNAPGLWPQLFLP